MNILITAGGTSEKIDDVRHLTNHATGSLGREIATCLQQENVRIHYVYGPKAVLPSKEKIVFHPIHSVKELEATMKDLLTTINFDYVIHSMAVSDYELGSATNEELLAKELANKISDLKPETSEELEAIIKRSLLETSSAPAQKKISSKNEKLILVMKKAPKVISSIKKWQPTTNLIGFKLLVDVPEAELISVAQESIKKNQASYILANDLTTITENAHLGLLVSSTGVKVRFNTKKEIAQGLVDLMITEERRLK